MSSSVSPLKRVMTAGTSSNRLLRLLILALALLFFVASDATHLLFRYPFSVDLEIPLRAAERWLAGGDPYLASAFSSPPGATQPFLYPPYVLAMVAPLTLAPRLVVQVVWLAVCIVSFAFFARRLAFPIWSWLIVATWPPVLEPLIGGNVQLVIGALFAWIFWTGEGSRPFVPLERDLSSPHERGRRIGVVAALSSSVKVSQPQAWLYVARRLPMAALLGASLVAVLAALSILITGLNLWLDWFEQLRRATDPAWELGGIAIGRLVHPLIGAVVTLASFLAILFWVPRRRAGAWVGLLAVVGSPSLHLFGLIFLIPAMLVIRRELALIAAILVATTTYEGTWAGIAVVTVAMVAGLRSSVWLEPSPTEAAARA